MLEDAGTTVQDIQVIIVAKGPGGFSALRVGMGLAKGMAESLGVPLVGVSTLELEATHYFSGTQSPLCPMLEVGRDRIAWSLYERSTDGWAQTMIEQVTTLDAMVDAVPKGTVFCGEGAYTTAAQLQESAKSSLMAQADEPLTRQISILSNLGLQQIAKGEPSDNTSMEPNYLRAPSITMPTASKPK
jgi:tRNA threonylcarbamoyladenosine biosynthesis protein TsaB